MVVQCPWLGPLCRTMVGKKEAGRGGRSVGHEGLGHRAQARPSRPESSGDLSPGPSEMFHISPQNLYFPGNCMYFKGPFGIIQWHSGRLATPLRFSAVGI